MEVNIDAEGGITPRGAETFIAAVLAPQTLEDTSPPKRMGWSFKCPDCDETRFVETGTPYSHKC